MSDLDYKALYLDLVGRLEGWAVQFDAKRDQPGDVGHFIAAELRNRMAVPADLPRRETSASIAQWQRETFGEAKDNRSSYLRAEREMFELFEMLSANDSDPKAVEEIADVTIVMSRIVAAHGKDLQEEIDRKMAINRARKWQLTGDGHGQHVEEGK